MSLQLVRITGDLPEGFDALRAEADAEGHRNMNTLAREWASGETRFEALLAAFREGDLAGVGGMTLEPEPTPEPAIRMRRLYVAKAARRDGVARTIASALVQEALGRASLLTVHAGGDEAALFWESQAFVPVSGRPWTHEFRP